MVSGRQVAEENYAAFAAWLSSKSDDDFRESIARHQRGVEVICKVMSILTVSMF